MKLSRVERDIIIKSEILEELTHKSKNLYNYANYLIRKNFFETGKLLKEFELTTQLAKEELKKQENYLGKRVKRGLFKSSTGRVINADVNGAIGIFRKVVPDLFNQWLDTVGSRGFASNPLVIKLDYKGNFNNV